LVLYDIQEISRAFNLLNGPIYYFFVAEDSVAKLAALQNLVGVLFQIVLLVVFHADVFDLHGIVFSDRESYAVDLTDVFHLELYHLGHRLGAVLSQHLNGSRSARSQELHENRLVGDQ